MMANKSALNLNIFLRSENQMNFSDFGYVFEEAYA